MSGGRWFASASLPPSLTACAMPVTASRAPTAGAALRLITVTFAGPSRKSNVLWEPTGIDSSTSPTTVTNVSL